MQFPARQNGRSLYDSGGSQLAGATQNVQPFQFVEINLRRSAAGISQIDGQYLPQLEGFGFTVLQADWPVTITPNAQQARYSVGIPARTGVECAVQFKGLTLSYPEVSEDYRLRLVVWKQNVRYSEAGAVPRFGSLGQIAVSVSSAVQITASIWIPEGARFLESLSIYVANTTNNGCLLQTFTAANVAVQTNGNFTDNRNGIVYGQINPLQQNGIPFTPSPSLTKFVFDPMVIPTNACRFSFNITGTGLSLANFTVNPVFS